MSAILARQKQAAGLPEDVSVLLAGLPDGGRIDEGQRLFDVVENRPKEQTLVSPEESHEENVSLDVELLSPQIPHHALLLDLLRADIRGEKSLQAVLDTLLGRELGGLVQGGITEERCAGRMVGIMQGRGRF